MLQIISKTYRKNLVSPTFLKHQQPLAPKITQTSLLLRNFWSFSNSDDDDGKNNNKDKDKQNKENDAEESTVNRNESSIVAPYGDNSPKISPLLILPTNRRPVFPGYLSVVTVKDKTTIDHISNMKSPGYLGVFLRQESGKSSIEHSLDTIKNSSEIYNIGTFASVNGFQKTDIGMQLFVVGQRRITLKAVNSYGPPTIAEVKHWKKPSTKVMNNSVKALMNEVMSVSRDLLKLNELVGEAILRNNTFQFSLDMNDPYRIADFATALLSAEGYELQKVLEATEAEERLSLVLELLAKEREISRIQKEISRQVDEKVAKQQREYLLREQLKTIKKELGMEKDDKDEFMSKYTAQLKEIEDRAPKEPAIKTIKEEMKKLESLEKNSPEFNVTRGYLDWLFSIPWGHVTKDVLNLQKAKVILDEDHYGLEEIKKRILEFIAVGKLKGSVTGKIICFVGPPGVGKTSIGKSIARALDRKFYRFSVGGLTDTAEIKGHRRTYIGALPGKPIQCLKHTKCMNPLILIDEIDKLSRSWSGDPASALLELLDPNQNSSFVDHYLDVPVDFSNVLFVCTANDESTIPGPLKDRMEMIRLSGYDTQEKVAIASRYLVPKALKEAGLVREKPQEETAVTDKKPESESENDDKQDKVPERVSKANIEPIIDGPTYVIEEDALEFLIKKYCRESGVRSLEKTIDKLARKLAFERVGETETETKVPEKKEIVVKKEDLEKYIGKPVFQDDTIYEDAHHGLPVGVVLGLAWNPFGGSPIFIETVAVPCAPSERDSGVHMVTGQLGDVMKESVKIAYTFARKFVMQKNKENKFFSQHQLHLHVPEGAISKDGPSAGVAMATSFVSVALQKQLKPNTAMTGELSLTGKVLPVGGIKEKTLAAKRSGAKTIILPFANRKDFDELPDYVKADVEVHFVKEYQEVFKIVFPDLVV